MTRPTASVSPLRSSERAGRGSGTTVRLHKIERQGSPDTETPGDHSEYIGFIRRVLRALARRVGAADPEDLALMVQLRAELNAQILEAVKAQRAQGFSWAQIAAPLGITRQSAQEQWGGHA